MKLREPIVLLLGILSQILGTRITLDEEAQNICKEYKLMCKPGKICAVQHFDWSKNITLPVCIPLSFVPVRNMVCDLPPEVGHCGARYIRWYYNKHSGECTFFRYSGCNGNQNNFRSKSGCQTSCMSTPHINLYGGGEAALVQVKPAVVTSPIYQRPQPKEYEALNSVMLTGNEDNYDRYPVMRHRRINTEDGNTRKRRRLGKEKAKERKRRERRKERKRLKKLRRRKKKMLKMNKRNKHDRKRKPTETDGKNETPSGVTPPNKQSNTVEEVKNILADATQTNKVDDAKRLDKRRKRKKRRQRRKRRLSKDKKKKRKKSDTNEDTAHKYQELVAKPESVRYFKRFSILDQEGDAGRKAQANSLLKTSS